MAIAMAKILYTMKRFVGTKYGISNKYIQTTCATILYGIGQGSGGGPSVWLAQLLILFQLMEIYCQLPTFTSPNGKVKHRSPGTGYVDDVTLFTVSKGSGKIEKEVTKI